MSPAPRRRRYLRPLEWVVIAMMGTIVATVMLEVFMRGLFGMSLVVTEELARYLMIWTALLGAVLIAADDMHLRITLVPDMLGGRLQLAVEILAELAVIAFLGLLIYATTRQLPRFSQQNTLTLGINMAWVYAAIPVSAGLMALCSLQRLYGTAREFLAAADAADPEIRP